MIEKHASVSHRNNATNFVDSESGDECIVLTTIFFFISLDFYECVCLKMFYKLHTIGKMETYDINCDIDVEKIHEILFDGCDMSDMEEPVSLASHPGPPNMDNEVSEETCDTDVEEIIENCQEKSDTEQSDTDI